MVFDYVHHLPLIFYQIKNLDLASRRVSTLAGTGKAGFKDGSALAAQVEKHP